MALRTTLLLLAVAPIACGPAIPPPDTLTVYFAASLSLPMARIADRYEADHPGSDLQLEALGSRTAARMITELNRRCDVFVSADYTIIDEALIPDYADWNLQFLGNAVCVAYHEGSKRQDEIEDGRWLDVLAAEDVTFARCDPDSAPCGYRANQMLLLAGAYYDKEETAAALLEKGDRFVRPDEAGLLPLLDSGTVDYALMYESTARQFGYSFISLPDEINLGNPAMIERYRRVEVTIRGPGGETFIRRGDAIIYGVTIPRSAPNPEGAIAFVEYLLQPERGIQEFETSHLRSVAPQPAVHYDRLPEPLRPYALPPTDEAQHAPN